MLATKKESTSRKPTKKRRPGKVSQQKAAHQARKGSLAMSHLMRESKPLSPGATQTSAKSGETATGDKTNAATIEMPADVISLATATFAPNPAVAAWLEQEGDKGGDVRVALGQMAQGTINVKKSGDTYSTTGKLHQGLLLSLPGLQALADAGVAPMLAVKISGNIIEGYLTIGSEDKPMGNVSDLANWIKENAGEMGWLGMDLDAFPKVVNRLENGVLRLQIDNFAFTLGGFMKGSGSFGLTNETVNFQAKAVVKVPKLTEAELQIQRDEQGQLSGRIEVLVDIANFSGSVVAEFAHGTVDIEGMASYQTEKLSGKLHLLVTDAATANQVARQRLAPDAMMASKEEMDQGGESGPKPGPRALAGWGVLNFAFTDWMTGQAQVIVDGKGQVTVVGEIKPPAEVTLFKQRDFVQPIFKLEVRAVYGIPLVGNLFLFANIGMDALAKLGPGKLYDIVVKGTYSTDPKVFQDFSIQGTLNISAFAGLRLRAEGGVGVEIFGFDVKAGVGVNALAGIRGYVEATPTIGYRESGTSEDGKKGEYYLKGHMEIAAQPFLALSGDLFVEVDSWLWSDKWTWPIGSLEYPLPGEFGIGADLDYVIGSDKLPEVQFGKVDFNKDKFMTDLLEDKVPKKSKGEQEKKGEWQEEVTGASKEPKKVDSAGASKKTTSDQQTPPTSKDNKEANKKGGANKKNANDKKESDASKDVKQVNKKGANKKNAKKDAKDRVAASTGKQKDLKRPFKQGGDTHHIQFKNEGKNAELMVASSPRPLIEYLESIEVDKNDKQAAQTIENAKEKSEAIYKLKKQKDGKDRDMTKERGAKISELMTELARLLATISPDNKKPPTKIGYAPEGDNGKVVISRISQDPNGHAGSAPSDTSALWNAVKKRKNTYVRGHLLNHHLYGPGVNKNLTPITIGLNNKMSREVEEKAKTAVFTNNEVISYNITAVYGNRDDLRDSIPEEKNLITRFEFDLWTMKLKANTADGDRQKWTSWEKEKKINAPTSLDHDLPEDVPVGQEPVLKRVNLTNWKEVATERLVLKTLMQVQGVGKTYAEVLLGKKKSYATFAELKTLKKEKTNHPLIPEALVEEVKKTNIFHTGGDTIVTQQEK